MARKVRGIFKKTKCQLQETTRGMETAKSIKRRNETETTKPR